CSVVNSTLVHMSHLANIRIDKAVTQIDVSSSADPQQTEPRSAGICFAEAGVQFLQCVVHIRETMMAAGKCPIPVFPSQVLKAFQDSFHPGLAYGVKTVRVCRSGREADRCKPDVPCEVFVDAPNVRDARAESDTSANGIRFVTLEQHLDPWHDHVI